MAKGKTAACMIGKLGEDAKDFSDDELDEIIERLEGRRQARADRGQLGDATQAMFDDAARAAYEMKLAAAVTKRNAALNVAVQNQMRADVAAFAAAKSSAGDLNIKQEAPAPARDRNGKPVPVARKGAGMSDVTGFEALLASSNKRVYGARDSYDAIYRSRYNEFVEDMFADLKREGALEYLQGRKILGVGLGPGYLDQHIMDELWELSSPNGKPGVSESPEALKAATIIHKHLENARIKQNRRGAFIEELRGYIAYQMHDPEKLRKVGFAKWFEDVLKHGLDVSRTFGPEFAQTATPEKLQEAMRMIYDNLTTGQMSKDMPVGPEIQKGVGVNLAAKVSHRRVIHFNDAKGWGGYNGDYGHGSLMDSVLWTLERSAKTAAMLERFGTNPRANLEKLRGDLIVANRADHAVVQALKSRNIDTLIDVADGAADQIDSPLFATAASIVRTVETQSSLGGMVMSAITDMPTQAARLTYNGKNFFEALGETVSNFVGGATEQADHLAFGVQGMITDVASRFHGNDSMSGWFGKMNSVFFKANLASWWDQRRYRGFIASIASELYAARNTSWKDLKPDVRSTLATYKFGDKEWDLVRKYGAAAHPSGEGGVIHGEGMRHIPDAELKSLLSKRDATPGALDRLRDKLERMVRSYYADQLAWATLQPGVREKALTTQGLKRGTAVGELARSFFLFKGYPLQVWQRVIGQFTQEDHHVAIFKNLLAIPKSEQVKLAQLIASMTAMGYMAMVMKDIAKGRTPRDPTDANTWGAAFLQGGGMGIYGDFLFGQVNRYGSSPLATFGGPVAGDLEAGYNTYNAFIHGDVESGGERLFKFGKENTPFVNIFYARAALDYLIFYRIQEWMSPGSLRRMERKLKTENDQEFLLPPSQVVN